MGVPGGFTDPQRLTFTGVKAGTYMPGNGCPDGIHYDVKGNLWVAAARLGGIIEIDSRGLIVGFVAIPVRAACACPRNRNRAPFPARRLSDREVALCTLAAVAVICASGVNFLAEEV